MLLIIFVIYLLMCLFAIIILLLDLLILFIPRVPVIFFLVNLEKDFDLNQTLTLTLASFSSKCTANFD